ncbi:MAG: PqqD family peptide modification chaperone [Acidimicrobiales bacterium]
MTVAITTSDAGVKQRFDRLLAAMSDPSENGTGRRVADIRIGLVQAGPPGTSGALVDLWLDGSKVLPWASPPACEDRVLSWINRWVLDGEPELVHLHAGMVSRQGVGVLIVGPSGAGKSTLVAHLVRSGWVYHSDEMVALDPHDPLMARAFCRPPTLKEGSWPLFAELPTVTDGSSRGVVHDRLHIPPDELGPLSSLDSSAVGAVVFLSAEGSAEISPIRPSEAVTRCVAETLDLGRIGVTGMGALVRLITNTQLYRLGLCELDRAAALLSVLPEGRPSPGIEPAWELLPEDPTAADQVGGPILPRTPLHRASRAASWALPDGAVVYDPAGDEVTVLNPSAAEIWRRLDGASAAELAQLFVGGDAGAESAILATLVALHDQGLVTT